ncbi:MAG: hypothetical protein ACTSPD_09720 [Promethearchaeota archaeon]
MANDYNGIIEVELVEKDIISIDLVSVDVIYSSGSGGGASTLDELSDVTIASPSEKEVIARISGVWKNYPLKDLLSYYKIIEAPTKISSTRFRTSVSYISGELIVYVNGIKEKYFSEINSTDFELELAIDDDDIVEVEFLRQ